MIPVVKVHFDNTTPTGWVYQNLFGLFIFPMAMVNMVGRNVYGLYSLARVAGLV